MSNTTTSVGPGAERGGNEDHGNADGRGNKTLGEHSLPEPEIGNEVTDAAAPQPGRDAAKAADAMPDGPNVENSPWEVDAARGKPHKPGA
jgi:hypothetical protein